MLTGHTEFSILLLLLASSPRECNCHNSLLKKKVLEARISFLASEDPQTAGAQAGRSCPLLSMLEAEAQLFFTPKAGPRPWWKADHVCPNYSITGIRGDSSATGPQDNSCQLGQHLKAVSTRGLACLLVV